MKHGRDAEREAEILEADHGSEDPRTIPERPSEYSDR